MMRGSKVASYTFLAMLSLAILTALAVAEDKRGRIVSFDPMTNIMIFDDGHAYMLQEGVQNANLAAGQTVVITFNEQDGRRLVTAVTPTR